MEKLCIVTGTMRSGTTLMGELLFSQAGEQRHPHLVFDNDRSSTMTVRKLAELHRLETKSDVVLIEDPAATLTAAAAPMLRASGLDFRINGRDQVSEVECTSEEHPPEELPSLQVACGIFSEALKAEIRSNCQVSGVTDQPRIYGLKCTHLTHELRLLASCFDVRTILMIRDPRDVLASNLQRITRTHAVPIANMVLSTFLAYDEITKNASRSDDLRIIKYEHLVSDATGVLKGVLDFLGLDKSLYDWAALSGTAVTCNSSFNAGSGLSLVAASGISSSSVGGYKTRLSQLHQYLVETLLGDSMRRFGYRPELPPSPEFDEIIKNVFIPDLFAALETHKISSGVLCRRCRDIGYLS